MVFIRLLNQPGLASALRQHREELLATALQFTVRIGRLTVVTYVHCGLANSNAWYVQHTCMCGHEVV